MFNHQVSVFSDGSCHTQLKVGAWAAIIFIKKEKFVIKGVVEDTTHNHMEIKAVIESIKFVEKRLKTGFLIEIYTDSQLVEKIPGRKEKLRKNNFLTKKGSPIQNEKIIREFIELIESYPIDIYKVKAHQKSSENVNYNREVDKLVRKTLRSSISKDLTKT